MRQSVKYLLKRMIVYKFKIALALPCTGIRALVSNVANLLLLFLTVRMSVCLAQKISNVHDLCTHPSPKTCILTRRKCILTPKNVKVILVLLTSDPFTLIIKSLGKTHISTSNFLLNKRSVPRHTCDLLRKCVTKKE